MDYSWTNPTGVMGGTTSDICAKCIGKGEMCKKCSKKLTKEKRMATNYTGGAGVNRTVGMRSTYEDITKRIDRLLISEVTVVGGSYIDGTVTNVVGSQQTRAGFEEKNVITTMQQKEPGNEKSVKFNNLLGAYVPVEHQEDQEELRWSMDL